METIEDIPVFIRVERGKTICICHAKRKKCSRQDCLVDCVSRDRYDGCEQIMNNKYGL